MDETNNDSNTATLETPDQASEQPSLLAELEALEAQEEQLKDKLRAAAVKAYEQAQSKVRKLETLTSPNWLRGVDNALGYLLDARNNLPTNNDLPADVVQTTKDAVAALDSARDAIKLIKQAQEDSIGEDLLREFETAERELQEATWSRQQYDNGFKPRTSNGNPDNDRACQAALEWIKEAGSAGLHTQKLGDKLKAAALPRPARLVSYLTGNNVVLDGTRNETVYRYQPPIM